MISTNGFSSGVNGVAMSLVARRMAVRVISGIGCFGAGVIIPRMNTVHGVTTAATVWSVAGIRLA